MPIPKPTADESNTEFMARCMSDEVMKRDFPDTQQRLAVCLDSLEHNKNAYELSKQSYSTLSE